MKNKSKPKSKVGKVELWWCIKSGRILLPHTAKTTSQRAIEERVKNLSKMVGFFSMAEEERLRQGQLPPYESVVRIRVTEEPSARGRGKKLFKPGTIKSRFKDIETYQKKNSSREG